MRIDVRVSKPEKNINKNVSLILAEIQNKSYQFLKSTFWKNLWKFSKCYF